MLDTSAIGHTIYAFLSTEKISYKYTPAVEKTNKSGEKTYTAIRNAKEQEISIKWHDSEVGQHLTLWSDDSLAATFTLTNDKQMLWQPQEIYSVDKDLTAKPSNPNNPAIVSTSFYNFFQSWINSKAFSMYLDSLSREQVYPPSLVKLLLLFISYLNVRTKTAQALGGKLTEDLDAKIDSRQVAKIFSILINQVVGDTPHMVRMYSDASTYLLPAGTSPVVEKVDNSTVDVPSEPTTEAPKMIDVVDSTQTVTIQATEPEKVEPTTENIPDPATDPNTQTLKRIEANAKAKKK